MFIIREDLPPILRPVAFLLGVWEGDGQGDYPGIDPFYFRQRLTIELNEDKPYLVHESRTWNPQTGAPMAMELGFWRPQPDASVELVLSHPTGFVEVFYGLITARSVELATDAVVRTGSAKDVSASKRLYGITPDEDLGYVVEMAAMGHQLRPHLSAKLTKIGD